MDLYRLDAVDGGRMYFSNENMGGELVVMEGTDTQTTTTPTIQPETTEQGDDANDPTDTHSQGDDADQQTATPGTPTKHTDTASNDGSTASPMDETTATNGPGFGVLTTIAGAGVGMWRYLSTQ